MSKLSKIILGLSLLTATQINTADQFVNNAWEFLKTSPLAWGALGSAGIYAGTHYITGITFQNLKEKAAEQVKNSALKDKQETIKAFCRERGVKVDYVAYKAMNAGIMQIEGAAIQIHNGEVGIRVSNAFLKDSADLTKEEKFILGHECRHSIHGDQSARQAVMATLVPCAGILSWHLGQLSGKEFIISLSITSALMSNITAQTMAAYLRYQESRADAEASNDPATMEAGAAFFEKFHERHKKEKRFGEFFHKIMTPQMHPHPLKRAKALREQAAKLRTEQEGKTK